ncbi:MAG: response regulator [Elusimicrobiota bacterium]|jgi:phosphoribosyl 1,2-cyclic phosphodiesterase
MSAKKVLLVEDDDAHAEFEKTILMDRYEVERARDGIEGLEKVRSFRPDVVVVDIMMPKMHGYEFCQRLKADTETSGMKVIICSAKSFFADQEQARAVGADDYLVKPYSARDLLAKIDALIFPGKGDGADAPFFVRFWGTRGSCATGSSKTVRYGGNTACVEVRIGSLLLIIDCGTGLRELGQELGREFQDRSIDGHIFVSHTHWDHIQGFPFFSPLYDKKNVFTLYSVRGASGSLEKIFSGSMASDYFPIPLSSLASRLRFVEMQEPVELGEARVSFHHLNHPGVCIGFRIEAKGRSVTYLSDHETFAKLGGDNEGSRRLDTGIVDFVRGSDLLIGEAQYTEEEYPQKKGWGHSTFDDTVRCAVLGGVKKLALFHHDPEHTDDMMDGFVEHCRKLARKAASPVECFAAKDGLRIDIPGGAA